MNSLNRKILNSIYQVMDARHTDMVIFDKDDNLNLTNQLNGRKYTIIAIEKPIVSNIPSIPNSCVVGVMNPTTNEKYDGITLDENDWDKNVLSDMYKLIYGRLTK